MAPDLRPLPRQEVGRGARGGEQGGREVQGCNQNLQTAIAKRNRSTINFDCGLLTMAEEAVSTKAAIPAPYSKDALCCGLSNHSGTPGSLFIVDCSADLDDYTIMGLDPKQGFFG